MNKPIAEMTIEELRYTATWQRKCMDTMVKADEMTKRGMLQALNVPSEIIREIMPSKTEPTPQDTERDFWLGVDVETCDLRKVGVNNRLWRFLHEKGKHAIYRGEEEGNCIMDTPAALWELQEVMLDQKIVGGDYVGTVRDEKGIGIHRQVKSSRGCLIRWAHDATNAETLCRAALAKMKADALEGGKG